MQGDGLISKLRSYSVSASGGFRNDRLVDQERNELVGTTWQSKRPSALQENTERPGIAWPELRMFRALSFGSRIWKAIGNIS